MNKKVFIGATLLTATVVGGVVYYRHRLLALAGQAMLDLDGVLHPLTEEARQRVEEALKEKANG